LSTMALSASSNPTSVSRWCLVISRTSGER
jgi:hypothetical protein